MKQTWLTGEVFQNIFPIPRAVFDLGLGPGDLLVYVYLLYRKNSRSGKCWPSYRDIGKAVGLDRKTIRKHVCSLVDVGLVETENTTVRWGGHTYNGNLCYTLIPIKDVLARRNKALLAELKLAEQRRKAAQKLSALQKRPRLKQ